MLCSSQLRPSTLQHRSTTTSPSRSGRGLKAWDARLQLVRPFALPKALLPEPDLLVGLSLSLLSPGNDLDAFAEPTGSGQYLVCDYYPAGNVEGECQSFPFPSHSALSVTDPFLLVYLQSASTFRVSPATLVESTLSIFFVYLRWRLWKSSRAFLFGSRWCSTHL